MYSAKIIADSISEEGVRLTTGEVTFPRMVLAEFNTHRVFSRNSASSRAIPFKKQLERVRKDPFIPVHWGANQAGMQAHAELSPFKQKVAKFLWLRTRDVVIVFARILNRLGLHKQVVNRLLEPFMWHTVIVTATEWSNFFALRTHEDAQPEIRVIAKMLKEVYDASEPKLVRTGEWHLPYIQPEEYDGKFEFTEEARQISAARCARVSYLTHDGKRNLDADLTLFNRLTGGGHLSPLEHVATPFNEYLHELSSNFQGWHQFRKNIPNESDWGAHEKVTTEET